MDYDGLVRKIIERAKDKHHWLNSVIIEVLPSQFYVSVQRSDYNASDGSLYKALEKLYDSLE